MEGWAIIDNDDYIKNITDLCGLLLFGYDTDAIYHAEEWCRDWGEDWEVLPGITAKMVLIELEKYYQNNGGGGLEGGKTDV